MTRSSGSLIGGALRSPAGEAEVDELAEIEAALLVSGLVAAAAVTVHEGAQGDRVLVAHVVPCAPADFRPSVLLEHLQAALPHCPIPSRFVLLDALPVDLDGEVDREALVEGQPQSGVFSTAAVIAATYDPLTAQLAALWADILEVAVVCPEDDFFELGGDSLRAARLALQIGDIYRVPFPVHALYEGRTLLACASVVQRAQRGEEARSLMELESWQADACLPASTRAALAATRARARPAADAWRSGEVFLTGATDLLGSFLLRELLTTTSACVHCLVTADDPQAGMVRLRRALGRLGLWQEAFASRIQVVAGDLRQPRFGLDASSFEALAFMVDAVFHAAAHVNFVEPYSTHRPTNVCGTAEVLRLAATGLPKPVHHVSSIAVFGPSGSLGGEQEIHEDADLDDYLHRLPFDLGYAASKWVAEQLVWEAGRAGLPVTVYRPGYILGHSRTGVGATGDFMSRMVRGSIRIGAFPDLPRQRLEFVPVDYVSQAIVHIAGKEGHQNRAHHLVPPDPRRSLELGEFFALVNGLGFRLARWPYRQWVARVTEDARERGNPLLPLLPLLSERVYKGERTRWELHTETPRYGVANALWALSSSEIEFPAIDRLLVGKYLHHWMAGERRASPRRGARLAAGG
jgi:thioester reductase-like protein